MQQNKCEGFYNKTNPKCQNCLNKVNCSLTGKSTSIILSALGTINTNQTSMTASTITSSDPALINSLEAKVEQLSQEVAKLKETIVAGVMEGFQNLIRRNNPTTEESTGDSEITVLSENSFGIVPVPTATYETRKGLFGRDKTVKVQG